MYDNGGALTGTIFCFFLGTNVRCLAGRDEGSQGKISWTKRHWLTIEPAYSIFAGTSS